jgi:DNA-binding MarR family transcriptional regulator
MQLFSLGEESTDTTSCVIRLRHSVNDVERFMKSTATGNAPPAANAKKAPAKQQRQDATAKPMALALEANLSYRLSILNFLMGKATQRIYVAEGLTSHQWKILSVLHRFAPIAAVDIAKWVTLDKAAISRAIRQLCDAGLADRKLEGSDARVVNVALTAKGARVYERMTHETAKLQGRLLVDATTEEAASFFSRIENIEHKLRDELGLAPSARKPE